MLKRERRDNRTKGAEENVNDSGLLALQQRATRTLNFKRFGDSHPVPHRLKIQSTLVVDEHAT